MDFIEILLIILLLAGAFFIINKNKNKNKIKKNVPSSEDEDEAYFESLVSPTPFNSDATTPTQTPTPAPVSQVYAAIENVSQFKTISPVNETKVEGYIIEYNTGTSSVSNAELSKNVTMELKWDNSDGFGKVTQMDIERYVDGELKHVITKESRNEEDSAYFTDSKKGLKIVFNNENSDGLYDVIGENKIMLKVYYSSKKPFVLYGGDDTVNISPDDLTMSLDITEPITYEYKPNTTGFTLEAPTIKKYSYYIYSNEDDNNDITEYISSGNTGKIMFVSFENSTSDFFMKLETGEWIVKDGNNVLKTSDVFDDSVFTLVKSPKATVSATYVRITHGDKFLVKQGSSMRFLALNELKKDEYKNIDMLITEQKR